MTGRGDDIYHVEVERGKVMGFPMSCDCQWQQRISNKFEMKVDAAYSLPLQGLFPC